MSDHSRSAARSTDDLPLAELAYAPAGEQVAVRAALAIVMAFPIATLVYDLTVLAMFLFLFVVGQVNGSVMQGSAVTLLLTGLRIAASVVLVLVAVAGRRDRRVGPTAVMCLAYAVAVVVFSFSLTAYQWTRFGATSLPWNYFVQTAITSLTPGIGPFVSFAALRQLAGSLGERR